MPEFHRYSIKRLNLIRLTRISTQLWLLCFLLLVFNYPSTPAQGQTPTPIPLSTIRPISDVFLGPGASFSPVDPAEAFKAIVRIKGCVTKNQCSWKGSGAFIHESGVILTAWHVTVADAGTPGNPNTDAPPLGFFQIFTASDEEHSPSFRYWARIIASNAEQDIALLQIYYDAVTRQPLVVERSNSIPHLSIKEPSPAELQQWKDERQRFLVKGYNDKPTMTSVDGPIGRLDLDAHEFALSILLTDDLIGFSGSPVLLQQDDKNEVIGIIVQGHGDQQQEFVIRTLDQIGDFKWQSEATRVWGENLKAVLIQNNKKSQLQFHLDVNMLNFKDFDGKLMIKAADQNAHIWRPGDPTELIKNFSAQRFIEQQTVGTTINFADNENPYSILFRPILWDVKEDRLLWQSEGWYSLGAAETPTPLSTPAPTATDTSTPNLAATETAVAQAINSAVMATLTALVTPTPTPTATPTPPESGATRTSRKDNAVYIYIPAGEFLMGSADTDSNAQDDEKPQHRVYVDGFWIMRTEVTNAQYAVCVVAKVCAPPNNTYWQDDAYANHPVTNVFWEETKTYAQWADGRLPTEAEWEKAARGDNGRLYPWGDSSLDGSRANFDKNPNHTNPVGSYPDGASLYGVLDMAGNVWEWVSDRYSSDYYVSLPDGVHNPQGPTTGHDCVLRGGSFNNDLANIRAASRHVYSCSDYRNSNLGFRVVRLSPPEP